MIVHKQFLSFFILKVLSQLTQVPIVVHAEKKAWEVRRSSTHRLVMIFEVGEQFEHYDALFLKICLDARELHLKLGTHDSLFIHRLEKFAMQLRQREYILQGLKHMGQVQETLIGDISQVAIVQEPDLLKILWNSNTLLKFAPLRLQHIHLKVCIYVVDEEAHLLAE